MSDKEIKQLWTIKEALKFGIFQVKVVEYDATQYVEANPNKKPGLRETFRKSECFRTFEEAAAVSEEMRVKEVKLLDLRLENLRDMKFTKPEEKV